MSSSSSFSINDKCCLPASTSSNPAQESSKAVWYGRTVNWLAEAANRVSEAACLLLSRIIHVVQKVLHVLGCITSDTNMLAGIFRRLNGQVLAAYEQLAKLPAGSYEKLKHISSSAVGWIDTIQVAGDVQYFATGAYKDDTKVGVASRVSMAAANLGGALLWLEEMSFISLTNAAAALGEIRVFSFVPAITSSIPWIKDIASVQSVASTVGNIRVFSFLNHLSMNTFARRSLTLMYVFLAVDAVQKITTESDVVKRTQSALKLSYYLSELALDALVTVGVTNVLGLGAAGALCIATAIAQLSYRVLK